MAPPTPELAARYATLGELPDGTFGRLAPRHQDHRRRPQLPRSLRAPALLGRLDRGAATAADLLDPSWDFWGATGVPLDELRRAYSVLPLDPALAA